MSAAATAALAKDSAPNTKSREKTWKDEIHTPAATYNANVPLDVIEPDPKNRDKISKENVAKMAASIQEVGLLQPIVLRELGGGRYRIIAGEHRYLAHKDLKVRTIRAMIYKDQSELEAAKKKAVENAHRVDLTPIERAKRFRELAELGANQKEIGELFGGLSQPVVANAIRMLELPPHTQQLVSAGELSEAHGVSLVRFAAWPAVCNAIASRAAKQRISSKDLSGRDLPYGHELVRAGLAHEICVYSYSGQAYSLPKEFKEQPGFFGDNYSAFYLKPSDPKADKWLALKPKLDAQNAAKAAAADKKEAGKQSKMTPAAKAERQKVIAENKQARAEATLARAAAFKQLGDMKDLNEACLVVVAKHAFSAHWKIGRRAKDVAKQLGIALPAGFADEDVEKLGKLKPLDLLRLVAGCILDREAEDAISCAWAISDSEDLSHVLGKKKVATIEDQAEKQLAAAKAKKGGAK